jgi:hypothetical protein
VLENGVSLGCVASAHDENVLESIRTGRKGSVKIRQGRMTSSVTGAWPVELHQIPLEVAAV